MNCYQSWADGRSLTDRGARTGFMCSQSRLHNTKPGGRNIFRSIFRFPPRSVMNRLFSMSRNHFVRGIGLARYVALMLPIISTTALADWNFDPNTKYYQLPDRTPNGYDVL